MNGEKQKLEVTTRAVPREYCPQTTKLIEMLESGKAGDVLTYVELSEACGRDVSHKGNGAGNLATALRFAERVKGVVWGRPWGEGKLECMSPGQMLRSADVKRKRINKAAKRWGGRLLVIDPKDLSPEDREQHGLQMQLVAVVGTFLDSKVDKHLKAAKVGQPLSADKLLAAIMQPEAK